LATRSNCRAQEPKRQFSLQRLAGALRGEDRCSQARGEVVQRLHRPAEWECSFLKPNDYILLVLKYSSHQLTRVEHQLKPEVAHFEHTQVGLGIAHLETEPILFVFKTPVTEIQLSVTLNFNYKFVRAGSNEADYLLHDLSLRCEPLETEYDDYMTYYQNMEYQNELPSFKEFFTKAHTTPICFLPVTNPNRPSSETSSRNL
jgi:hypothetical protein